MLHLRLLLTIKQNPFCNKFKRELYLVGAGRSPEDAWDRDTEVLDDAGERGLKGVQGKK